MRGRLGRARSKQERESAVGADEARINALIDELYVRIFERSPSESERVENRELLKLFMAKLEQQQAIAKLIESLDLEYRVCLPPRVWNGYCG